MDTHPDVVEIKNILQQHTELLIQLSKDQGYLRGELNQMNERFSSLDARMDSLETRVNTAEGQLNNRINEVESRLSKEIRDNLRWMIGLMILVWIGILIAVLTQFVKG